MSASTYHSVTFRSGKECERMFEEANGRKACITNTETSRSEPG
jgi:hypothetical protein